jgi:hypothetical protein
VDRTQSGLFVPRSSATKTTEHRKADAPFTGEIGQWASEGLQFATLPGGGVLQFDLNRLTLADYRAMRDHYQINANLTLLTFMIHQIDWRIECSDKRIANEIEEQLRPLWSQIVRGMAQAFWAGFSPLVLQYENDVQNRRITLDKVKDLMPEDSDVNWKEIRGYNPGNAVAKKRYYVYDGIKQVGESHPIPVENTLWYPLLMENGNYSGRKLLRSAFVPWFFSMLIHLYANRYFERFGEPLPIGRADYDNEFNINGEVVSGRKAMENILYQLRSRSVVVLPSDRDPETKEFTFDLEYLESQMRGADFERYLTRLDEEMSLGLFTPILMLRTVDVGSYNLGINHMQVWMWMLNAIAADMKTYLDKYLIQRLKAFNFSPNAPRAEWKPRPLGKQDTETMRAIILAMVREKMVKPADLVEFGQALGLSLQEIREIREDGDGDGDQTDERTGRPERNDATGGLRVENSRATSGEISERVRTQVTKAFREGTFGTGDFMPALGYRRRFEESLMADGASAEDARTRAGAFFSRLEAWLEDFVPLGEKAFTGPNEFMTAFDRVIDTTLDEVA